MTNEDIAIAGLRISGVLANEDDRDRSSYLAFSRSYVCKRRHVLGFSASKSWFTEVSDFATFVVEAKKQNSKWALKVFDLLRLVQSSV